MHNLEIPNQTADLLVSVSAVDSLLRAVDVDDGLKEALSEVSGHLICSRGVGCFAREIVVITDE